MFVRHLSAGPAETRSMRFMYIFTKNHVKRQNAYDSINPLTKCRGECILGFLRVFTRCITKCFYGFDMDGVVEMYVCGKNGLQTFGFNKSLRFVKTVS